MPLGEIIIKFKNRDIVRAIYNGDIELLENCFREGLSPATKTEKEQWNLLHQATLLVGKVANYESIKLLISKGVNVNAIDYYGNMPIHYAVRNNDIPTIKMLVQHGSNVDHTNNDGINPLHQALLVTPTSEDLIAYLLDNGAVFNESVSDFSASINNAKGKTIVN